MERHGCGLGVVDYSDRCHAAGTVVVFIVVVGIIALLAYRRWLKRKADKESYETTHD
jgi:predicted negative regulator of RcsB-dependent stress response